MRSREDHARLANASDFLRCTLILAGTLSGCAAFSAPKPADAKITADVEQRLNQYRELLPPAMVYVQTLDGVVYLKGQVTTDIQRDTAISVAQATPGVRRVIETLTVTANFGR